MNRIRVQEIITLYTTVKNILNSEGIDTSKSKRETTCSACRKVIEVNRCKLRKNLYIFCDRDCYISWLKYGGNCVTPFGMGRGFHVVEQFYGPLPEGSIVHHENGSIWDCRPENLVLFKDKTDHVLWHTKSKLCVPVLWMHENFEIFEK